MTNEKVLEMFLKKHRLYSSFKRQKKITRAKPNARVKAAIDNNFIWSYTVEGQDKWGKVNAAWKKLCFDLDLKGNINIQDF